MEALKQSFENLPESERVKLLGELLKISADSSPSSNSPENFKGDSRRKQRTLDSWLIKRDRNQNKLNESPSQTNEDEFSDDTNHTNNTPEKTKIVVIKDASDHPNVERDDMVPEKPNLRRSKRKLSKCSSSTESCDNTVNCAKKVNNAINVSDSTKDSYTRTVRKLRSNRELIPSHTIEASVSEECSLSNEAQTSLNQNASSNVHHLEQIEYHSYYNSNVPANSKATYKHRNKRKKSFNKSGAESSSGAVAHEDLNSQLNAPSSETNEQVITATTSQNCNYEAFEKLNAKCSQIGLNVIDILGDEKIKNLLNDNTKLVDEAVVFIGSFKSSTGKVLPVVHSIESKKKLLEGICLLQKIQNQSSLQC